jgi:anti-sigma factor RsiW
MSRCKEIRKLIPWYIAGSLSKEEEREVAEHLSRCELCRDDLALTTRLRLDVRTVLDEVPDPSPRVREEVKKQTLGRRLAQLDIGSFFLGLSLGASLRKRNIPIRGDLNVMGRKIRLFNTGKRGGDR